MKKRSTDSAPDHGLGTSPSPAKKAKTRPKRAAAQRASQAVTLEAQPSSLPEGSSQDTDHVPAAPRRRRASVPSKAAGTGKKSGAAQSEQVNRPQPGKHTGAGNSTQSGATQKPGTVSKTAARPSKQSVLSFSMPTKKATSNQANEPSVPGSVHARGQDTVRKGADKDTVPAAQSVSRDTLVEKSIEGGTASKSGEAGFTVQKAPSTSDDTLSRDQGPKNAELHPLRLPSYVLDDVSSDEDVPDDLGLGKNPPRGGVPKTAGGDSAPCSEGRLASGQKTNLVPPPDDHDITGMAPPSAGEVPAVLAQMLETCTRVLINQQTLLSEVQSLTGDLQELSLSFTGLEEKVENLLSAQKEVPTQSTPTKGHASRKKGGGVKNWEAIMEAKYPNLLQYFDAHLWGHAVLFATFDVLWCFTDANYNFMDGVKVLSAILLARSRHGKKDIFDSDIGQMASKFRFRVLQTALSAARQGCYRDDVPEGAEEPEWLGMYGKETYIEERHIRAGQAFYEQKCSNTPEYHRRVAIGNGAVPNRDDFAVFIAIKLYKRMNELFMERRRKIREDLCEVFLYLFLTWKGVPGVHVDEASLSMFWKAPSNKRVILPLKAIPQTSTEDENGLSAVDANKKLYQSVARRRELQMFVIHDVLLARGEPGRDGKRRTPGSAADTPRTFRRWLNLSVPVSSFLLCWGGMEEAAQPWDLLQYHSQAMKVLYYLCNVFRDMVDVYHGGLEARAVHDGLTGPRLSKKIKEEDLSLVVNLFGTFCPDERRAPRGAAGSDHGDAVDQVCASSQDRAILHATCAVDETLFEAQHKPTKEEKALLQGGSVRKAGSAPSTGSQSTATDAQGTVQETEDEGLRSPPKGTFVDGDCVHPGGDGTKDGIGDVQRCNKKDEQDTESGQISTPVQPTLSPAPEDDIDVSSSGDPGLVDDEVKNKVAALHLDEESDRVGRGTFDQELE